MNQNQYEDVLTKSGFETEHTYKYSAASTNKKNDQQEKEIYLVQPSA